MKWWSTALLVLMAGAALAEPPTLSDQIDAYVQAPRTPGTFRALANLGDPGFGERTEVPYRSWDEDRIFLGEGYGGQCRTAYAHKIWKQRTSELARTTNMPSSG
jgi:hypothetical protein